MITAASFPTALRKLSYDDYRNIQFRPDDALWRNQAMFEVQFFHRGFNYDRRVNVTEVGDDGVLHPVNYNAVAVRFRQGRRRRRTCPRIWGMPACACTTRCSDPTTRMS